MLYFIIAFVLGLTGPPVSAERIRRVTLAKDQIAKVNTAIGVATIIQVPDPPTSLVVGNQEGFKVEFLETAITVKPVSNSSKSNLYIYTDYRRFDVQLATGPESLADYVVYLDDKKVKAPEKSVPPAWRAVNFKANNGVFELAVLRIGKIGQSHFFDFEVACSKPCLIKPEWFWITQRSKTIPIQRLVLSKFAVNPGSPVRVVAELVSTEFTARESVTIELRGEKTLRVTIPKDKL